MYTGSGNNRTLVTDFTQGSVFRELIVFSLPLFLSSVLQIVYNMVDMIIVGRVLGKPGLSGVSVGGDVLQALTMFAMGFCNAGQVLIAKYIGEERRDLIGRFISTMALFLGAVSLSFTVVCFLFRNRILMIMNTPPEAYAQALGYSSVCIAGLVFIYGYNAVSAVLRGIGDSRHPFVFISIAALLNVVLDILFVAVMGFGAAGAAFATVISQGTSFICCVIYLYRIRERLGFEIRRSDFKGINPGMLSALVKLGIPMAIKSMSVSFSKLFVNSWINSYGVAVSAFAGIANKINSMSNVLSNSLNTAGSSMVGQNIGAGKYSRVKKIMFSIFSVTVSIATVLSVLIVLFPSKVYGLFTSDAEVIAIGMRYIPIAILIFYGSAARSGMNALMNGSGNYRVNFAVAILDGIILRIGLALLFGLILGMKQYGFWLGDALAGFTPLWIGIFFYFSGAWKVRQSP